MIYNITEQQLKDYMFCPLYYYLKYNNKVISVDDIYTVSGLLNNVTSGFFMKLLDNKLLEMYDLKRKWDMLSSKHRDIVSDKNNINGMGLLQSMYRWAESIQLIVASEQEPYRYEIPLVEGDNSKIIALTGTFRTIMVNNKKQLEFLYMDYGNRIKDQLELDLDLKTTIDCAAFIKKYNKRVLGCRYHFVKHNKDGYTNRSSDATKRLNTILRNVINSINNDMVYPRHSPLCSSCKVRDLCIAWS